MGLRLIYRTYREGNRDRAMNALSDTCELLGHPIDLKRDYNLPKLTNERHQAIFEELDAQDKALLRIGFSEKAFTLYLPYLSGIDFRISKAIGIELGCPWFEIRIQEGNHWDYSFYKGVEHIDQFSADPRYFGGSRWKARGNPRLIEREWGIDHDSISRYVKHWHWFRRGKAYPDDKASYGDYEQFFDFLRAIGAPSPEDHYYALDVSDKTANN